MADTLNEINQAGGAAAPGYDARYSTLAAWEAASDVSAGRWIGEITDNNEYLNEAVTIGDATGAEDANNFVWLRVASANRHQGVWGTGHARLTDDNLGHVLIVSGAYAVVQHLQIEQYGSGNSDECIRTSGSNNLVDSCLLRTKAISQQDCIYRGTGNVTHVSNCVGLRSGRTFCHGQGSGTSFHVVHCSAVDNGAQDTADVTAFIGQSVSTGGTFTIYNCAGNYEGSFEGCYWDSAGGLTWAGSHNIADDATAEAKFTSSYDSVTVTASEPSSGENWWITSYALAGADDLTLAGENSFTVHQNGTNRSGNESAPQTTDGTTLVQNYLFDITGSPRNAVPSIGAFEYLAETPTARSELESTPTINTANAIGAKVLRAFPFTEGSGTKTRDAAPPPGNILFVVGNSGAPNADDVTFRDWLVTLGYTVTYADDSDAEGTADYDVVIISESVSAGNVGTKYFNASAPVLVFEGGLGSTHEFCSSAPDIDNAATGVIVGSHWIVTDSGLSGTITFSNQAGSVAQTLDVPASGVTAILDSVTTGQERLGVIDTGGTRDDTSAAPNRRAWFGLDDTQTGDLTADGEALIASTIRWLVGKDGDTSGNRVATLDAGVTWNTAGANTYKEDFSGVSGSSPTGWTNRTNTTPKYSLTQTTSTGTIGDAYVDWENNGQDIGNWQMFEWDAPGLLDVSTDGQVQVLAKIQAKSGGDIWPLGLFTDGDDGPSSGYTFRVDWTGSAFTQIVLFEMANGAEIQNLGTDNTSTMPATGEWWWYRMQNDAAGALKLKFWKDGDVEPSAWNIEATDTSITSGYVGIGTYSFQEIPRWDYISVGINGDAAPFPWQDSANSGGVYIPRTDGVEVNVDADRGETFEFQNAAQGWSAFVLFKWEGAASVDEYTLLGNSDNISGLFYDLGFSDTSIEDNAEHSIAWVADATDARSYLNGTKKVTDSTNGGTEWWESSLIRYDQNGGAWGIWLGDNLGTATNMMIGGTPQKAQDRWEGPIELVLLFDSKLSDAEMASLSANPWQAFNKAAPAAGPTITNVPDPMTIGATGQVITGTGFGT